jgi:hypothetical protein
MEINVFCLRLELTFLQPMTLRYTIYSSVDCNHNLTSSLEDPKHEHLQRPASDTIHQIIKSLE